MIKCRAVFSQVGFSVFIAFYSQHPLADSCDDAALYCDGNPRNSSLCSAAQLLCNNEKDNKARATQTLKNAQDNYKNQDSELYRECTNKGMSDADCRNLVKNVGNITSSTGKRYQSNEIENIINNSKSWMVVKTLDGKSFAVPDACEQLDFQRHDTYSLGNSYHIITTYDTEVEADIDFNQIRFIKRVGVDHNNNKSYFRIELTSGQVADYTSISVHCRHKNSTGSSAYTHINNNILMTIDSATISKSAPASTPKLLNKR